MSLSDDERKRLREIDQYLTHLREYSEALEADPTLERDEPWTTALMDQLDAELRAVGREVRTLLDEDDGEQS